MSSRTRGLLPLAFLVLSCLTTGADASQIFWTDWKSSNIANGFTANGTITTATDTVAVTYQNVRGVSFFQDGVNGDRTDYFTNSNRVRIPSRSPYTSSFVDNIPTAAEMIALKFSGSQTLSFSKTVANPVFSYVSLNGNGYAFDQDFDILSFGDGSVRDAGFWGAGTSSKKIVDLGGGKIEYQLIGTGEPHGTIRFKGAFDRVTWRSLTDENWNGFTVGIQGTAVEIFTPEPSTFAAAGLGLVLAGFGAARRRKSA